MQRRFTKSHNIKWNNFQFGQIELLCEGKLYAECFDRYNYKATQKRSKANTRTVV